MSQEKELLEQIITERVDEILEKHRDRLETDVGSCGSMMEKFSPEERRACEAFKDNLYKRTFQEYIVIYKDAFCDGLRLAHKAF